MSDNFKVNLTKIRKILPHPNAERLEIAEVYGFNVAVQKGRYAAGDLVLYVPIDSVLSPAVEAIVFPPDSKIKLYNSRVKQIRIRSVFSQGLIVDPETVAHLLKSTFHEERDYAEELGITKYEPPTPTFQQPKVLKQRTRSRNSHFRDYGGLVNAKWEPDFFGTEEVVITEKLHGTNVKFGKAPYEVDTLIRRILKFFRLTPKFESVYGSNRTQIDGSYKGYYGEDIYGAVLKKINAFDKVKPGEFVYGEIIGPGIQKNYDYGFKEHFFVMFDVRVLQPDGTQKWLNPEEAEAYAAERGFAFVPVLYRGPYSKEIVDKCTVGSSCIDPNTKVREGCVVKSRYNYDDNQNKRALKSINPEYLSKDQTDFH